MFRFVTPFQGYIFGCTEVPGLLPGLLYPVQGYDFFTRCRLLGLPLICVVKTWFF